MKRHPIDEAAIGYLGLLLTIASNDSTLEEAGEMEIGATIGEAEDAFAAASKLKHGIPEDDRSLIVLESTYDTTDRSTMHDSWQCASDMEDALEIYNKAIDKGASIASICAVIESTDYPEYAPAAPEPEPQDNPPTKSYLVELTLQIGEYQKVSKSIIRAVDEATAGTTALLNECHRPLGDGAEWLTEGQQIEDAHGEMIYSLNYTKELPYFTAEIFKQFRL